MSTFLAIAHNTHLKNGENSVTDNKKVRKKIIIISDDDTSSPARDKPKKRHISCSDDENISNSNSLADLTLSSLILLFGESKSIHRLTEVAHAARDIEHACDLLERDSDELVIKTPVSSKVKTRRSNVTNESPMKHNRADNFSKKAAVKRKKEESDSGDDNGNSSYSSDDGGSGEECSGEECDPDMQEKLLEWLNSCPLEVSSTSVVTYLVTLMIFT